MKVFVTGPETGDYFTHNVAHAFRSLGHEVRSEPTGLFVTPRSRLTRGADELLTRTSSTWRQRRDRWAIKVASEFKPALTFVCTRTLEPETVAEIRRRSHGVVVCWFGDTPGNIRRGHIVSGEYDAIFLKDLEFVESVRNQLGLVAYHLDEACNPAWHRPVATEVQQHLLAAGTLYGYRAAFLGRLLEHQVQVRTYGPPPSPWVPKSVAQTHAGIYLDEKTKAKAFGEALVCLNTFAPAERNSLNCRIFETCGCGGLLLSERKDAVHRCFDPGIEYLEFGCFKECLELIDRALKNRDWSEKIRRAAVKRAHGEHTYEHRITTVLKTLSISGKG